MNDIVYDLLEKLDIAKAELEYAESYGEEDAAEELEDEIRELEEELSKHQREENE